MSNEDNLDLSKNCMYHMMFADSVGCIVVLEVIFIAPFVLAPCNLNHYINNVLYTE